MLSYARRIRFQTNVWSYAALWGIAIFLNGLVVSALLQAAFPHGGMNSISKAVQLSAQGFPVFALMVLGFAPFVEAAIAQWLPLELMRKLNVPRLAMVLGCGVLFGGGHYLSNGINHGLKTFIDGLIYAELYLCVRPKSAGYSWLTVTVAHFVNNLCVLSVLLVMRD